MECYYHPSRESTDNCAICGKSICKECGLEIAGNVYCKECLEKIVGLNLAANKAPEPPKPEPVRLAKKEVVEEPLIEKANLSSEEPPAFNMAELTKEEPQEPQFLNQRVAEDSPYNIKDNIQYEGGIGSNINDNYQPKETFEQEIETPQTIIPEQPVENVREEYIPQEPVENVREEYVPQEPITQARNEYDTLSKPQSPPTDDYIYPDHSYQPEETSARKAVEDKYAAYLDDLYFDEEEVPLNEQLARDEEKYGSLTRNEYQPKTAPAPEASAEDDLERRIREELMKKEKGKEPLTEKIHNIDYEDEKEPYGAVDIILTAILIIVILIVVFYIIYLFKLSASYPTFIDAIYGLANPGTFFNALLS